MLYAALPLLRRGGVTLMRRLTRLSLSSPRLGRWSDYARQRWKPFRAYLPIALIVIAGAVLTAWAADAFLDLAELVHSRSPVLQNVDAGVHDWAVSRRTPGATRFFAVDDDHRRTRRSGGDRRDHK